MIGPVESTVPVTYKTQKTFVEVVPGKEPGDKKYVETSYDTIVYESNGQTTPVTRVNRIDYYA